MIEAWMDSSLVELLRALGESEPEPEQLDLFAGAKP